MRKLGSLAILCVLSACVEPGMTPVGGDQPVLPVLTIGERPAAATTVARAVEVAPVSDPAFDAALNGWRSQRGLSAATPNARLNAAAQAHADDMTRGGFVSHRGSNGSSYQQRIAAQGYTSCYPVENIGAGQATSVEAMQSWLGSAAHTNNMRLQGRVEYGLGRNGDIHVLLLARVC